MIETEIFLRAVDELRSAEAKHDWTGNNIHKNALILAEEAGEVSRAVLRYTEEGASIEEIEIEIIQTIAMCMRLYKSLKDVDEPSMLETGYIYLAKIVSEGDEEILDFYMRAGGLTND